MIFNKHKEMVYILYENTFIWQVGDLWFNLLNPDFDVLVGGGGGQTRVCGLTKNRFNSVVSKIQVVLAMTYSICSSIFVRGIEW